MNAFILSLLVLFLMNGEGGFFTSYSSQNQSLSQLKVSKSGRYLVKENGDSFFWLGDTGWNLFIRLNREEAKKYLTDRHDKKFTVIQAHVLGWSITDENAYGYKPFVNNNFNTPNEDYWTHVDYIIQTAEDLGLYMGLLPA